MNAKKVLAITGATGAQGGGLLRAILADQSSEFAPRAITRNPDSEKARAIAAEGVEVVSADLDDVESLKKAFSGAYGAYCVTNFWEHFSPEREIAQANNLAEAAKTAGLRHVVWSTLEDTRKWVPLESDQMPTLQNKYKVPHFDAKGKADQRFRELGVPTTFLLASFYWDNMIHFGSGPQPGPDGVLGITFPLDNAKMAGIAAEDIGKCAYGIFKRGEEMIGKTIGIAGEHLTGAEMAAALTRALGREVRFNNVTPETFRAFGFPGSDDLGNMFQFYRDFESDVNRTRDVARSRELNPELQSFDQWLAKHKHEIPLG